jgi:hypothetical protein
MSAPSDIDDKIRTMVRSLDSATPNPPSFGDLHQFHGPARSRLVPLAGAAVIVVVGVGGIVAVNARDLNPATQSPPSQSPLNEAPTTAAEAPASEVPTGPLLSTDLDAGATPFIVPGQPDWELTNAFAQSGAPLYGGFEGSTVFVGDGPTYDAPLFVATVVGAAEPSDDSTRSGPTTPSLDALLESGDPIEVAGTTGAVTVNDVDTDSGLTGPVVTLFWPLGGGMYARVNAVRLSVDEVVSLADQLSLAGDSFTMQVPDGYRELATPEPSEHRHFSYRFAQGERELEVIGENRGVASLLGRIAGEVRSTRVIDDVEVAYRPQPNNPGQYWVDWQAGAWSYYVIATGFVTEDEFIAALSSLTLTDATTFEAAGTTIGLVMPGEHNELADRVLANVTLSDDAFDAAATTELAMSADSYGFELFRGAACAWHADWTNAVASNDTAGQATILEAVEATIAANAGTDFDRAAQLLAVPLLDRVSGRQPQTENDYTQDCPDWALSR